MPKSTHLPERRYKMLEINQDIFLRLLMPQRFVLEPELPADVDLVSCEYDLRYQLFRLILTSKTFDPVPLGCVVPKLPMIYVRDV